MDLYAIADNAVRMSLRDKLSAPDAVRKACSGRGLNAEQLARVSGMTNRKLLQHSKASSPGSVPERFETAKADEVSRSTEQLALTHTGQPEVGGAPAPAPRPSVVGPSPSAAGAATLDEIRAMLRQETDLGNSPLFEGKTSSSREDYLTALEQQLRQFAGIRSPSSPDGIDKVAEALAARAQVEEITLTSQSMAEQLDVRTTSLQLKLSGEIAGLAAEIDRAERTSGFTLGELLDVVQRGMQSKVSAADATDAFVVAFPVIAQEVGLDLEAAAGTLREDSGSLKTSSIQRARARLFVRDAVAEAGVNPEHPLFRKGSQVAQMYEEIQVLNLAKETLRDAARRGHQFCDETATPVGG